MDINWFLPLQAESEGQVDAQCCDSSALEPAEQTNTEHRTDIEADASASIDIEVVKETNLTEKIIGRIEKDPSGYGKAVNIFAKSVIRLPSSVDTAL